MFKGHPRGLYVAFFANMGERFGFYTMMGILVFYLTAKFGLTESNAGIIYSVFYGLIYGLALVGGIIADRTKNYKGTIYIGLITMLGGYVLMAIPGFGLVFTLVALFVIAFGNGLFKGNLQAVVGQLYDAPKYSHLRDSAFSVFYMGINVGALFAPSAAAGIINWFIKSQGFSRNDQLPSLSHEYLASAYDFSNSEVVSEFQQLANTTTGNSASDLTAFAARNEELQHLCEGQIDTSFFGLISNQLEGDKLAKLQELANQYTGSTVSDLTAFANQMVVASEQVGSEWYNMLEMSSNYITFNGFTELIPDVTSATITNLAEFAQTYIDAYGTGFNYAFGVAGATMVVSFIVYTLFKRMLPDVKKAHEEKGKVVEMSREETKQRLTALFLVFGVVIFFWMAFHQNGLTMSFFARDYTITEVGPATYLVFNIWSLLAIVVGLLALGNFFSKGSTPKGKFISIILVVGAAAAGYYFYSNNAASNPFSPELFQHFNPTMIVLLTPVIVGLFAYLSRRKSEPSAPRKIGYGMVITSIGFLILLVGSLGLDPFDVMQSDPNHSRVGTGWLISTYFTLTVAELFLSPMGISFVSKVSPPKYQGLMQGGWLGATALGNQMLWVGSYLYERVAIWQLWALFIVLSLIAASFIFSVMKKLEKVS